MRQIKLIQVILVFQLSRSRYSDALCAVVRLRLRLAVYSVAVHFRGQVDELCNFLACRLILELADHLF